MEKSARKMKKILKFQLAIVYEKGGIKLVFIPEKRYRVPQFLFSLMKFNFIAVNSTNIARLKIFFR